MIKLMQDGKEHYFDKNGIEIVKGSIIRAEDTVYTVYRGDLYGEPAIAPACCEACAREATERAVKELEQKIAAYRSFQVEKKLLCDI